MEIPRFSSLLRCRKWAKSDWLAASIGFVLTVFFLSFFYDPTVPSITSPTNLVKLKLSSTAKERGAFCLDGSLPGFHFDKGSGSGSKSWLIHLQGGGWCNTIASCSARAMTSFGSSNYFEDEVEFPGVLSNDPSQNPDFFNWNRVVIRYCDGASFSGHPDLNSRTEQGFSSVASSSGRLLWMSCCRWACQMPNRAYLLDVLLVAWQLLYIVTTFVIISLKMQMSNVFLTEDSFLTRLMSLETLR
ncbi:unnamed protein product [Brassica oleracea var. botrytis]